jgi:hypothetical protein
MKKLSEQILELCWEIEKLPASEQQTKVIIMASNLQELVSKDEWPDDLKPVIGGLEEIKRRVHELDDYPRVAKLIRAKKNFIIIAEHEPYFVDAYGMIRQQERMQGTWTAEDENLFRQAISRKVEGELR